MYTIKQQQKTVIHTPCCMLALSLSSFCKLFSQKQSHTWSILQKQSKWFASFTQLSTLNFSKTTTRYAVVIKSGMCVLFDIIEKRPNVKEEIVFVMYYNLVIIFLKIFFVTE